MTRKRGGEQGGKSPFSLLSEPISPSSLLFEPISPSSLNGYVSFSPSSLLSPPISPSSQLFLAHFSLLPILFLPPPERKPSGYACDFLDELLMTLSITISKPWVLLMLMSLLFPVRTCWHKHKTFSQSESTLSQRCPKHKHKAVRKLNGVYLFMLISRLSSLTQTYVYACVASEDRA